MRCLDHIDMAAMAGAVTVTASAVFFFAYLGIDRGPLAPTEPETPIAFLQEELVKAITVAGAAADRAASAREVTQVAMGKAVRRLTQVKPRETGFVADVAENAAALAATRREFLEARFKLPSDWGRAEFQAMEREAERAVQPELGQMIVSGTQALGREMEAAETGYGRTLLAATQALERAAIEPDASLTTVTAATTVLAGLGDRATPAPIVHREPAWGFGSIGDGAFLAIIVLGAGAMLVVAAGMGLMEGRLSTRKLETRCDTHGKDVAVEMLLSDDTPYEVVRCSAFNGGPVTCDKHCLAWPVARAA
ncbi:MAG: hypothetical protein AB1411_14030 [Nitrospirota bacterium]